MTDLDKLLSEADNKFDLNDFAGARDLLRQAALIDPHRNILFNLQLAEKLDVRMFLRDLQKLHSDVLSVRIREAAILESAGYWSQAIKLYTEILDLPDLRPFDKVDIRLRRFEAACRVKDLNLILEDFPLLWDVISRDYSRVIVILLTIVTKTLNRDTAIPILEALEALEVLPVSVRVFLKAQIQVIRTMYEAIAGSS